MKRLWTPWRMAYLTGANTSQPSSGCVFCAKVGAPDESEHMLYRGQFAFITLNRYPYNNGHLMIIPYAHVASLENLDPPTLTELMLLTNRGLAALRQAYHPDGFNIGVNLGQAAGAGVADHVHIHIVPRWSADTNFMPIVGETRVIPETLDQTYARLRPCFDTSSQSG
jgi:ATP adenylyltransferase